MPFWQNLLTKILGLDPNNIPDIILFFGRFHPLVVHLPIGLLLAVFALEVVAWFKPDKKEFALTAYVLLVLGTLSALFAAAIGMLLSLGGGYDDGLLSWHTWLGLGTGFLCIVAIIFKRSSFKTESKKSLLLYRLSLFATVGVLSGAGHYGGSLTHGSDYLFKYAPDPIRKLAGFEPNKVEQDVMQMTVFDAVVKPIFEERCFKCHGADKNKGDLRLNTPEDITKGGASGKPMIADTAEASELFQRIILPEDSEDRMPPGGAPLNEQQIAAIKWWIESGTGYETKLIEANASPEIIQMVQQTHNKVEPLNIEIQKPEKPKLEMTQKEVETIKALRQSGLVVLPLFSGSDLWRIDCTTNPDFDDLQLVSLAPIAQKIAVLNLSKTSVTNDSMGFLKKMPELVELRLDHTSISNPAMEQLAKLGKLQILNLVNTEVSDSGLAQLQTLSELKSLYLWQTKATTDTFQLMQKAVPNCEVNIGWQE